MTRPVDGVFLVCILHAPKGTFLGCIHDVCMEVCLFRFVVSATMKLNPVFLSNQARVIAPPPIYEELI